MTPNPDPDRAPDDSNPDIDTDDLEAGEAGEAGRYRRYKPTHPPPRPSPMNLPQDLPMGFQRCGEPFQVNPGGAVITIVVDGHTPLYWDW